MLTVGDFARETGAQASGSPLPREARFSPSTDSRTVAPGQIFVCLRGPHFDGHDHIAAALEAGAIAVVADDRTKLSRAPDCAAMLVGDAKLAYLRGAAAVRRAWSGLVIGVTGSVGKTTTKEMCARLLATRLRVLATPRNENNELGVAKACYALGAHVDVAVIEMGARAPGEIAQLVDIASPDIGVLTGVAEAHLEFFTDREQLARTKFALFGKGARAVLSAADEWSRTLAAQAGIAKSALWVRLCGDPAADGLTLEAGEPRDGRVPLTLGASHAYAPWSLPGEHHLRDALLAGGAAVLAGLTLADIVAAFGDLRLPEGRFEQHRAASGAIVVYDAYNASPASMTQTLRAFSQIPAARRIAVLGSMAELGPDAGAQHEAIGVAAARAGLVLLYCGGPFATSLAAGAR
ncbi:MAG TPA: UDP-N-acetylmuramoyl-tripeptide--D-alanyl-D-alanine ligase, partial [Candidatus Eremiobacteraceae bacterium]|nr:UDP-N-acetylmuramoyl-tripeptide--D-alanyl-D-alanine ligase [Candidatus Eremiobacteraceae bacterium]